MSSFNIGKISVQHGNLNHFFLYLSIAVNIILFFMFAKHFELMSLKDSPALTHSLAHSACMYVQMSIVCVCFPTHLMRLTLQLLPS